MIDSEKLDIMKNETVKINALEFLKRHSTIVVDSGDLNLIKQFEVEDATTNPTLIFQSLDKEETLPSLKESLNYGILIKNILKNDSQTLSINGFRENEIKQAKADLSFCSNLFKNKTDDEICCELTIDYFIVLMGYEILKRIPGKVSTEIPPQYSFDKNASVTKALHLINLYERKNINKNKILIKLATTWEGIKASEELEKIGVHCNMTLVFSLVQAVAAAQVNVTLISPFVGRILDWYKSHEPTQNFIGENDPGVKSVKRIFQYYKSYGYSTIVMAASFRNSGEILELAGCDKLTISPKLLKELQELSITPNLKLTCNIESNLLPKLNSLDESQFRWLLNEDRMATEKLSEGIRNFYIDYLKLSTILNEKLSK